MASCWKKTTYTKDFIAFEKGKKLPGSKFNLKEKAIIVAKIKDIDYKDAWEVRSNYSRINPNTISGSFKSFKSKNSAMRFVKKYLKENC